MILERTFVKRERADEQVALIDGACGLGKRRRDDGDCFAGVGAQGIQHRPDVAVIGGIKGGADLVHDVARAALPEPGVRRTGLRHGLGRCNGADLQRHDHDTDIRKRKTIRRNPDSLHGSQAAFGKRIGEIRRSRIVISNTAKWSHEGAPAVPTRLPLRRHGENQPSPSIVLPRGRYSHPTKPEYPSRSNSSNRNG